ncbi:MAG: ribosome hibernation-promoting factor, HPF/YfiA family [Bdellovibrionota bacterium]
MQEESGRVITTNISFRNTEATEALKQYASEKITNVLRKFVRQDTDVSIVLSVEKTRHIAEVSFRADGADFNAKQESTDLYASIDGLVDNITSQLRRHKEKIQKR